MTNGNCTGVNCGEMQQHCEFCLTKGIWAVKMLRCNHRLFLLRNLERCGPACSNLDKMYRLVKAGSCI